MAKPFEKVLVNSSKKQPGDSHFCQLKVKDQFLERGHFRVNSGAKIRFWKELG
jgi:hypothetical protein